MGGDGVSEDGRQWLLDAAERDLERYPEIPEEYLRDVVTLFGKLGTGVRNHEAAER